MSIRFVSKATVNNKLVKSSNVWDGTAAYNPFTLVGNYDALATVTVPSGGLSSVTFAGIPQTGYDHLQIRCLSKTSGASSDSYIRLGHSGTALATSYRHLLYGDGSSAAAAAASGEGYIISTAGSGGTNIFSADIVDVLDYANVNKNKTIRNLGGRDLNGSGFVLLASALWNYTNAVTSIELKPFSGSFVEYSQFALYGVKS